MREPHRVLIIASDVIVGIILEDLAATAGFAPSLALSLRDVEALIGRFEFSAAIVDHKLGDDSAFAMGQRLDAARIAHFYCSAATPVAVRKSLGEQAVVVSKPFEDDDIFSALKLLIPAHFGSKAAE